MILFDCDFVAIFCFEVGKTVGGKRIVAVVNKVDFVDELWVGIDKESIDAIRTAIWELEREGYVVRNQTRDSKGKMSVTEYIIYEIPPDTS